MGHTKTTCPHYVPDRRNVDPFAVEQFGDGADLQPRVEFARLGGRLVEAGRGGFGPHRTAQEFERDQQADLGRLAFQHAMQATHVIRTDLTGLAR